ncbi:hypothetical protein HAX54_030453 [Datura stramonium]|uniref:Uncharacterized protein n=1 Tax=Datura stramonium TaxID=4076 RepID=A0ABS8V819_DATST|nr:hypothetical protein [Datura stramonium]
MAHQPSNGPSRFHYSQVTEKLTDRQGSDDLSLLLMVEANLGPLRVNSDGKGDGALGERWSITATVKTFSGSI